MGHRLSEQAAGIKRGSLALAAVTKRYGTFAAVDDVSLAVETGEFVSLIGPSGSGKTTTLMMIAGFVEPDEGRILLDGRDIAREPPRTRGLGMVFQNYALFPHLTAADNVAFPLRLRGVPRTEIASRVKAALELVQLGHLGGRNIRQLSGGQQQRVALARAVVFEPRIVLMDEPLGALDKNLRFSMQTEIKEIQSRLGMTVIYVTHDQEEAMNMSDRLVIMNRGRIEQAGRPEEVYEHPLTPFAANFLGEANLIPGTVVALADGMAVIQIRTGEELRGRATAGLAKNVKAHAFIRPERVSFEPGRPGRSNVLEARVARTSFLGNTRRYGLMLETSERISVDVPNAMTASLVAEQGASVTLSWSAEETSVLADLQP